MQLWWLVLTQLLFLCVVGSPPVGPRYKHPRPVHHYCKASYPHRLGPALYVQAINTTPITNWEVCILCQAETDEPLQCPLRYIMKPSGVGYVSLTEDLVQFKGLRYMPMELNFNRLDDGDRVGATLRRHRAQWHKKCRLNFNIFFLPSRVEQNKLQDNNLEQVLQTCAHDQQLPTGFHSQPSLSVSSAIRQLEQ